MVDVARMLLLPQLSEVRYLPFAAARHIVIIPRKMAAATPQDYAARHTIYHYAFMSLTLRHVMPLN